MLYSQNITRNIKCNKTQTLKTDITQKMPAGHQIMCVSKVHDVKSVMYMCTCAEMCVSMRKI